MPDRNEWSNLIDAGRVDFVLRPHSCGLDGSRHFERFNPRIRECINEHIQWDGISFNV